MLLKQHCSITLATCTTGQVWWQVSLNGLMEFQNKKILDHFSPSFFLKNVGFKTWDFSPLILRVLGGVYCGLADWACIDRISCCHPKKRKAIVLFAYQIRKQTYQISGLPEDACNQLVWMYFLYIIHMGQILDLT